MTRPVDARSNSYVDELCALDPLTATEIGVKGHDHQLPDLSPDGFAAIEELNRRALADVGALTPSDELEAVARESFLERTGLAVERAEAGVNRSEFSVIVSGLHAVRSIFDVMPTESDEDWANIAARLAAVPATLAGYRATLLDEAQRGRVAAQRQYAEVASQVRGWTGQTTSENYFTALVGDGPTERSARLTELARSASAAYAEFGTFLEQELAPLGREADGVGRTAYELASRYFLGATIDLEEAYAWGWQELSRIETDMAATAGRLVPGGSVDDAVALLDADPTRDCGSREAFTAWMQRTSDDILARFNGVHFDIAPPLQTLDCKVAPVNDGGAWYIPPTDDFSRPGTMWFSFTDDTPRFSTWRNTTTVFHEGVPGHHLQCAQAVYRADTLNRWQRLLCWVSGHGEGWALYAERLMDDLGYFADPGDRMGFLDDQALRAARVIVDIGVHLGLTIPQGNPFGWREGETWDAAKVFEFMRAHTRMDDGWLRFEVNRYLGWPGQAPSYKVGEKIWLQAREAARMRKGAAFDLKQFHTDALNLGSLGLDPLQKALARL